MKSVIAATGLFAALIAAPSFAADAIVDVPYDSPGFSWTGGYVGLQGGYLWGDSHFEIPSSLGAYADPDPDGFLGGIYVGYNYQMANDVVVGIDADLAWTGADDFGQINYRVLPLNYQPSGDGFNASLNWSGAVRGRLGYAVGRFLPYIAGGVAFGDVDWQANSARGSQYFSDTMVGWTLGAGVEYAFTDNVVGRFEYRYTDFGDNDFSVPVPATMDLATSDVRFGIAYKF